jgi:hypothetical protein
MQSLMVDFIISLDGYGAAEGLARLLGHGRARVLGVAR